MARPSLFTHRKFARLSRILGAQYRAVGALEMLWSRAYSDGDPRLGSREDVEWIIQWDGEPGTCAEALIDCGFLDDLDGELHVHDLEAHAPAYVRKRKAREDERRTKSAINNTVTGQRLVSDQPLTRTPAPAPAPAPAPKREKSTSPKKPSWGKDFPKVTIQWAEEIFSAWVASHDENSQQLKMSRARAKKVDDRRKEGYDLETMKDAVRGWRNDDWPERPMNKSMEKLLETGANVEKFSQLYRDGPANSEMPGYRLGSDGIWEPIDEEARN